MPKNKVIIKCTEKQALIIELALDVLTRITMGQLEEIVRGIEMLRKKPLKARINVRDFLGCNVGKKLRYETYSGYSLGYYIANLIKPILFPKLSRHSSYGVGQKQIGDAQIAYEMVKKLQNFRAKKMENPGVLADEPLHYSKEPLIEVRYEKKIQSKNIR